MWYEVRPLEGLETKVTPCLSYQPPVKSLDAGAPVSFPGGRRPCLPAVTCHCWETSAVCVALSGEDNWRLDPGPSWARPHVPSPLTDLISIFVP